MKQIAKANDAQWQSNRPAEKRTKRGGSSRRIVPPTFVEPMQCKAVTELPEGADWTFEIKFDGYRCIAVKTGSKVALYSRNEKKLNARFPELAKALAELPGDFAIDGEIVALDEQGRPSFQLLQNSDSQQPPIYFYAFDLLNNDGEDLTRAPLERRREALNQLLAERDDPVRVSPLLHAPSGQILEAVQKLGIGRCGWETQQFDLRSGRTERCLDQTTNQSASRNLSSAAMCRARVASIHSSSAFTKRRSSSMSRK